MNRDEFNVLADEYYEAMDISDKQKKKRKKDAWELFDIFMLFFLWFDEARKNNVTTTSLFLPKLQNELQDVVSSMTPVDDYLISYLSSIAYGVYAATIAHINEKYYLSEERATNLALNESNSINNYLDTKDAQKEGFTHKKWVAQLDEKTRLEHIMMDGTVIPIDGYFEFSDCRMFAPHDVVNGTANQVANCRCSLSYIKESLNNLNNVEKQNENDTIKLPDEQIFRTLSAAARNYDVMDLETGEIYHLAEGTKLHDIEVFAGKGVSTPYRKAYKYADKFGNDPSEWQHVKGFGTLSTPDGDREVELHWSQCEKYGKHDFFVKRWLD